MATRKRQGRKSASAKEKKAGSSAVKATGIEAEAPAKSTAAAEKTSAKAEAKVTAAKEEVKEAHIFEIDGTQVSTEDVVARIKDAYKAEGHQIGRIKKIDVYYNFGERRAYYVINDNPEDKFVEF